MSSKIKQLDVLIVGAGISGIGTAYHLQKHCHGKSYAIIETRCALGGTWDLFRYPGIRSDSDMFTFGYNFKPWRSPKAISPGEDIRTYVAEAASENGIDKHILFEHKVMSTNWDSASAKWLTKIQNQKTGECCEYSSRFFFLPPVITTTTRVTPPNLKVESVFLAISFTHNIGQKIVTMRVKTLW